jgi:hypothetical protein
MTSALLWDITQRWLSVLYRRFGTTYLSHLHGSRSLFGGLLQILDPWRWKRYVVPKRRYRTNSEHCIIYHKITGHNYTIIFYDTLFGNVSLTRNFSVKF